MLSPLNEICRGIDWLVPEGGLISSQRYSPLSQGNANWRVSPTPFPISDEELSFLRELGDCLLRFYGACNRLYNQAKKGSQYEWIAEYLDQGKTDIVVRLGSMRRFRTALPRVIRPDIIPTDSGMILTELDSVPGGIGLLDMLTEAYGAHYDNIISAEGGVAKALYRTLCDGEDASQPCVAIVVSDESHDYHREMVWLRDRILKGDGHIHVLHPRELCYVEDGMYVHHRGQSRIDILYRFFELFDLLNIPNQDLIVHSYKKRLLSITPPLKAQLEEKLWFALFHHPMLADFWAQSLDQATLSLLSKAIPRTWILDPRPVPPHATIAGLTIGSRPVNNWSQLKYVAQSERELVIKPSGFSALAWGSRGVKIGHDMPQGAWAEAVEEAMLSFHTSPYILQEFHSGKLVTISYLDWHTDEQVRMTGRARLCPYYFVKGEKAELVGILATICPEDKKILHGMEDAVIVPCAVEQIPVSNWNGSRNG